MMNSSAQFFTLTVAPEDHNLRLDSFLAKQLPTSSRSFFQRLILEKSVKINDVVAEKPSIPVQTGNVITVQFPPLPPLGTPKAFEGDLGVRLVHTHPDFLVVYKPAGLMTHAPSPTSRELSLVDWLLTAFKDLSKVGEAERPGIVHRLDKDTSGLLIVPRTNQAHFAFGTLFKDRKIKKTYLALVHGHPAPEGTIDFPIARHPHIKHKMTHLDEKTAKLWYIEGRPAITHYRVMEQFKDHALLELQPVTGRTHQIRVHCAAIGHPLVGDVVYGTSSPLIARQALHASQLTFEYQGGSFSFTQELPADFAEALEKLRAASPARPAE